MKFGNLLKNISMVLNPADSSKFIVKNANHIKINHESINNLTKIVIDGIVNKTIDIENFSQHDLHPKPTDPKAIDWIFLVDTLNFCFWTPENEIKWQVQGYTGYFALCAAINRAISEGIDVTNPKFYSKIKYAELEYILRSDKTNKEENVRAAPLIQERLECLHQVGKKLLEKYNGSFKNCIIEANRSAENCLRLIVDEFPCYADEAIYHQQKVSFYKRAQILIGDIWSCFRGKDLGEFYDIEKITMFADYRVPQVLIYFNCLDYTRELMEFLKTNEIMQCGDEREIEIRGASIYIVEELKRKVLDEIEKNHSELSARNVNSILLDHFLWDYRRKYAQELEHIPYHKVLGIYY